MTTSSGVGGGGSEDSGEVDPWGGKDERAQKSRPDAEVAHAASRKEAEKQKREWKQRMIAVALEADASRRGVYAVKR